MKELRQYYEKQGYKIMDITKSINCRNIERYVDDIKMKPKVIAYFKRTVSNSPLFRMNTKIQTNLKTSYMFIYKEICKIIDIDEFSDKVRETMDKFLSLKLDCQICGENGDDYTQCVCTYVACNDCLDKMFKSSDQMKCPGCNKSV